MWILCSSRCVGTILALGALLVLPAAVQTQSNTPVASLTQNLGYYGGTTGTINTTGANLLVACVASYAEAPPPTFSDSKNNSWTLAVSSLGAHDGHIRLYYSVPTTVGSDHSFTAAGTGSMSSIQVTAWAGATTSPLDRTSGAYAGSTSVQPGAVLPTQNDEVLISCLTSAWDSSDSSRSINGGFTIAGQLGEDPTNYSVAIAGAYLKQTTATEANPTWSFPVYSTANAVIATFKTVASGTGGDLASKPMFDWNMDATLVGGFRTPDVAANAWSGRALAYHDDKLYMAVGYDAGSKVLQMNIPTQYTSDATTMQIAGLVQPPADITDGNMAELHPDTNYYRNRGLLVHGGKLIGSAYHWYDANNSTRVSHFSHSLTLNQSSFAGWMAVWDNLKTGYVSGPMATVPDYAQAALGGPVITTGAGAASILSRLSYGLAAFSFDPGAIAGRTPFTIAANPLMYFDVQNPMQDNYASACAVEGPGGCQDDPSEVWTRATTIGGVVIPTGSRTLLYFGTQGTGDYCYGQGTSNPALHGEPVPPENQNRYCYDPANGEQGEHAYPYRYQIWAFDLLDLAAVKAGTLSPWAVPYTIVPLEFPIMTNSAPENGIQRRHIGGIAYDAANKAIYVTQMEAEPTAYTHRPIIWKFTHQ